MKYVGAQILRNKNMRKHRKKMKRKIMSKVTLIQWMSNMKEDIIG